MTICLADNYEGIELILGIVLGREDLTIKSVRTQELLKNLQGRSAVLDVHAVDSTKREFDVEIQRSDAGAGAKRARHNSSLHKRLYRLKSNIVAGLGHIETENLYALFLRIFQK